MTTEPMVNDYLARLRTALTGMTLAEREDIVEEIRMHIRETVGDDPANTEEVLARLGPPEEMAEQYRTGLLLQKAGHSISPMVLLRATLRWGLTGVEGAMVFMVALFGYLMGVGFALLAMLKPIFPERTGLWVGPNVFDFSFRMGLMPHYPSATVHEVLGWWFIPVCLILASLTLLATTKVIQLMTRRFRLRVPLIGALHSRAALMSY